MGRERALGDGYGPVTSVIPLAGGPLPGVEEALHDSPRAWLVVLGAAVANGVAFGTLYTFGAFVTSMGKEFDSDLGPTLLVFGITMFLFFGTGALSGRWSDSYGPRPLVVVGGALFCSGLYLTSYVNAIWQAYVVYGIGVGFGGGVFSGPLFATCAAWFRRKRAQAQGWAATGPGLGTMLLVPFADRLIDTYEWRQAYRILAMVAAVAFVVALALIRRSPPAPTGDPREHVRRVIRSAAFQRLTFSSCCMSVALIGAFALVIPFAVSSGLDTASAAQLFSAIGASSIIGRVVLTSLAGRLGTIRLLQLCFATQPIAYLLWIVAGSDFRLLLGFAVLLGVSYGGFVALLGDATAHLFGLVGIGRVMGLVYMASGVGSLIGPPLGGFLADTAGRTVPLVVILSVTVVGVITLAGLGTEPADLSDPDPRGAARQLGAGAPVPQIRPRPAQDGPLSERSHVLGGAPR